MSLFLAGLPSWIAAIFLVVLPTIAAMCGPILMRRRIGLERLASNNEIAGFKFATVGVIYAVLLAFAVIVVWEKFSDAETAVVQEAGAAATLYRLAAGPEPEAVATRAALGGYLRLATDRDWPMMAAGKESRETTHALDTLYAVALRLTDKGSRHPAIFAEMFTQLDAITRARRTRLQLATGVVPGILWLTLNLFRQSRHVGRTFRRRFRLCRPAATMGRLLPRLFPPRRQHHAGPKGAAIERARGARSCALVEGVLDNRRAGSSSHLVSCWHANTGESEAMWQLYCPPPMMGVAIHTNAGLLTEALGDDPQIKLGRVQYVDFRKAFAGFHDRIYWKRKSLSHEAEVRAVIRRLDVQEDVGLPISIDIQKLLLSVVPSPFAQCWFAPLSRR